MNRLKDKIKKKWKTMAGMTVMLMFVFVVGFAAKAHFTSRAADDDRFLASTNSIFISFPV